MFCKITACSCAKCIMTRYLMNKTKNRSHFTYIHMIFITINRVKSFFSVIEIEINLHLMNISLTRFNLMKNSIEIKLKNFIKFCHLQWLTNKLHLLCKMTQLCTTKFFFYIYTTRCVKHSNKPGVLKCTTKCIKSQLLSF